MTLHRLIEDIYPSSKILSQKAPSPKPKVVEKPRQTDEFLEDLESFDKKKRKRDEQEEKKKKTQTPSRSVQSLSKVNTKGMKSLDSFFKKKE